MHCLGLQFRRPCTRVEIGCDVARGHGLLDEDVDCETVLGMHHRHHPGVSTHLQRPQQLSVVGKKTPRVGHEELDRGDPLALDQRARIDQSLFVHTAEHLVQRPVDDALTLCLCGTGLERLQHVAAGALFGKVDDRGGAAVGRRDGARLEGVRRHRGAGVELHVHVGVDPAGNHQTPACIDDDVVGPRCHRAVRGDGDDPAVIAHHV